MRVFLVNYQSQPKAKLSYVNRSFFQINPINGFLNNVYLKDFDVHDIMKNHLGYSQSNIDLTYTGNYKLELDTGFIKEANLKKKFKYGDNHILELHSELIQNG